MGNLGTAERWFSILAGLGLTLAAARGRGVFRRAALGSMGMSLLSRGAAGHCGMKAALSGESTLTDGISTQFQHLRARLGRTGAASIDSMESLFTAELQELHSAESQMLTLLEDVARTVEHQPLATHLRSYATEISSRRQDLERILETCGASATAHPDQGMRALIHETYKMAQVCATNVRDAGLVASVQRILHYKIAGYGTVAAYAKTLGRIDDAARFADYVYRDEAVDAELSELAKSSLNIEARVQPQGGAGTAATDIRTH